MTMYRIAVVMILFVCISCLDEKLVRRKRLILTGSLRKDIVDAHNHFRRLEGGSDMKKLKWHSTLALMAENYGKKCIYDHGQPELPKSPFRPTGQNIYVRMPGYRDPSRVNFTRVVESWVSEKENFVFDALLCTAGECGHYTQVVWATSEYVGCASLFCPEMDYSTWANVSLVVCNYGPSGNFIGRNPYKKGKACEACPKSCEDDLCV